MPTTKVPTRSTKVAEEGVGKVIIGVGLDAALTLKMPELREAGREAAGLGFESVWTNAGTVPDAFHICDQWSLVTEERLGEPLRTGVGVIPAVRAWSPASLALQAATLGVISGGRFVLGIGTGGTAAGTAGLPTKPLVAIRDYVTVLRRLLDGEVVSYDGPAVHLDRFGLSGHLEHVPVYIAALGPKMLQLAGETADGVCLNWSTPEQIAWSRDRLGEGAARSGRDRSGFVVTMSIRVCIDEDVEAARRAFATQVLNYSLKKPGVNPALAYRGHFTRMGFDEVLRELEARREAGQSTDQLCDAAPAVVLQAVGYYGSADGAAKLFAELAVGLDEAVVRVITARKGLDAVLEAMAALTPEKIRAAT